MILLSLCSIPWWLAWLLPFLIGLLLGWALWAHYKSQIEGLNNEIATLKRKISTLEGDLNTCHSKKADLEGDLAMAKGRMRELEAESKTATSADADVTIPEISVPDVDASSIASGFAAGSGTSLGSSKGGAGSSKDGAGSLKGGAGSLKDGAGSSKEGAGSSKKGAGSSKGGAGSSKSSAGAGSTSIYSSIKSDNLQIIEGIGPKMESVLKENGINTWSELGEKSSDGVNAILGKYGDKYTRIIDPKTWPEQARLASDGKFEELIQRQKVLDTGKADAKGMTDSKLEKYMVKKGLIKAYKQNDLKAIEGIGPKISGLLIADGITTWKELADASIERIQGVLDAAGPRYKLADPGTWPKQSGMAAQGKWKELQEYQDFLKGGK